MNAAVPNLVSTSWRPRCRCRSRFPSRLRREVGGGDFGTLGCAGVQDEPAGRFGWRVAGCGALVVDARTRQDYGGAVGQFAGGEGGRGAQGVAVSTAGGLLPVSRARRRWCPTCRWARGRSQVVELLSLSFARAVKGDAAAAPSRRTARWWCTWRPGDRSRLVGDEGRRL